MVVCEYVWFSLGTYTAHSRSAVLLLTLFYLAVQKRRPCFWLSPLVLDDVQRRHLCRVCQCKRRMACILSQVFAAPRGWSSTPGGLDCLAGSCFVNRSAKQCTVTYNTLCVLLLITPQGYVLSKYTLYCNKDSTACGKLFGRILCCAIC